MHVKKILIIQAFGSLQFHVTLLVFHFGKDNIPSPVLICLFQFFFVPRVLPFHFQFSSLFQFLTWQPGQFQNKMAAIKAIASAYREDSDSEGDESPEEELTPDHTAHLNTDVKITQLQSKIQLKSAPTVTAKVGSPNF